MRRSVVGGLQNIQTYISPEVLITQGQGWEDSFFWDGAETYSRENGIPHVALSTASRDLMWIASLDSEALRCKLSPSLWYVMSATSDCTCNSVE